MPETSAARTCAARERGPVEIRLEDVHKSFGGNRVLRGIDLEVRRGELVAVVGASGGGKTVLVKHIMGRVRPDRGRVLVVDHEAEAEPLVDLSALSPEGMDRLRRHWGVVFQRNALFTGTVSENIALGPVYVQGVAEDEARMRAAGALRSVGLDPDVVMDLNREDLSGGMAKRVAIARALALDPLLLFYDEPTTGLDPAHANQIQDLIKNVHESAPRGGGRRTTIVVTHDAGLLYRLAPRVVMLHEGRIYFDGPAEAFEASSSPEIRPYLDLMPLLHAREAPADIL
jgi:phospholipid/cholesterol/gamma-HCH transport system ATP-binding protein